MIRFSCPQCKLVLQAPEPKIGSVTACPKCGKRMKVPDGPTKARIEEGHSTQSSVDEVVAGEWFYTKDKKKVGPVSIDDIKRLVTAGQLQPGDLVFKTGMQKWLPVSNVLDLLPPADPSKARNAAGPPRPSSPGLSGVRPPAPSSPGLPRDSTARSNSGPFKPPALPSPPEPAEDLAKTPPPSYQPAETASDVREPSSTVKRGRRKAKRKPKRGGKSNRLLRSLVPAWLGIVLFRTVVLLLPFDPKLSLFLWPIEWLVGLAIAWLSYRGRLRSGILVGVLGPLVVLGSMAAFTNMGLSKEEGLEYLRYVMVPYALIAVLLGLILLRAARRGARKLKPVKSTRTLKKRPAASTMRLRAPGLDDDSDSSEMGAVGQSSESD